jgi:multidrug efflux pump subunit AcrA (membrane-fusion protein)
VIILFWEIVIPSRQGDEKMKIQKPHLVTILFVLIAISLSSCSIFPGEEQDEEVPVVVIDNSIVSASGYLVPEEYAYLSLTAAGRIDEVFVQQGQSVSAGQKLVSLGSLAQAESALAAAELELEAARQALDALNETADVAKAAAWLNLLDAKAQYLVAEEEWDELDVDALEDDIDETRDDIVEAEEALEEARDKFESYADLEETSGSRQRYEEELEEAQEVYNQEVRVRDELVIELETTEARWQSALAIFEKAKLDYANLSEGPDPDQVALAEARIEAASAQVDAALEQIENLTLKAPFNGVVADVLISEGEWASPGQPVVVLADFDSLRVETTDLNEIDVVQVEVGDMAEISFDALPDEIFRGTIIEISPKASEGSGVNYTVVIELDEIPDSVRWGMTVFVDIDTKQ